MKANHNFQDCYVHGPLVVSNDSKILKWKQITTQFNQLIGLFSCFQWFKDTKMKANHNRQGCMNLFLGVVSNDSKILKWKQITTLLLYWNPVLCCFQWFKDTKMKANHNSKSFPETIFQVVSNDWKILKWKQITTFKNSANNQVRLFPMIQRY